MPARETIKALRPQTTGKRQVAPMLEPTWVGGKPSPAMAETRRRQDWARPPGSPVAPRMGHHGCEPKVPPDTSLQAIGPEPRGAAQDGHSEPRPRKQNRCRPDKFSLAPRAGALKPATRRLRRWPTASLDRTYAHCEPRIMVGTEGWSDPVKQRDHPNKMDFHLD